MTTYGVTATGFVNKPLGVIEEEIKADQRSLLGANLNQEAHKALGQINGVFAAKCRENWELNEATYNSRDPDDAEDAALDDVAALCPGISRDGATNSRVIATVNLDGGITLPAGKIASVDGNSTARFVTMADATNPGGSPDDIEVVMEGETTGPVVANLGTLTVIETPYSGWNTVTNAADADLGDDAETNSELRLRREETIQFSGSSNVEAVKADLLDVTGVESAVVTENTADIIVNGLLPHTIYAVIWDGDPAAADDDEVAQAIFDSKGGGIGTNGAFSNVVEDSMDQNHTILFDRANQKVLEIQMTAVTEDPPSNWQAVDGPLITALLAYVDDEVDIGGDAVYVKLLGVATDFEWLTDMTLFQIRFTGDGWGVINLPAANDDKVTLDSGDVGFV